jgi:hypothetical protein
MAKIEMRTCLHLIVQYRKTRTAIVKGKQKDAERKLRGRRHFVLRSSAGVFM